LYAQEGNPASTELIGKAWAAHGKGDAEKTLELTNKCIELYKAQADKEQAALKELPKKKNEIESVGALNDVATAYFIQAEFLMRQGKFDDAKKTFQLIIDKYYFAQAWDQRGWYWRLSEAAEQTIKKIETGSIEIQKERKVSQLPTRITLFDPGAEDIVDYAKYGEFTNAGTRDYKYVIKDAQALSAAVGEGIYPNTTAVRKDPEFKKAIKEKRLEGEQWDFVHSPDLEAAFLKWATGAESPGVRLFYIGFFLEQSGLIKHAIKCYYSIVVHFPASYGWTYWHTPWYIGQAAISKINFLLRNHPELGYKFVDADIKIINGFDNNVGNDICVTNPGRFVKVAPEDRAKAEIPPEKPAVKRQVGQGKVHLLQYDNGDWQLIADGKPYVVCGITYAPTKVGESPDDGTMTNWMEDDFNKNGKIDGPYDAFVDKNRNNVQDADEPQAGDFKIMQEMGVNTLRLYHQPSAINKELLRDLYKTYGIRVVMGDFFGKYTLGSGAPWNPGTDYNNPEHKKNMLDSVLKMVAEFKDEPYILFWLLGNENVYGFACNANTEPDAFFKFANEAAKEIKKIDPDHPVAICNGDILFLDKFGKDCPDVDMFGANAYRGNYGFGALWRQVRSEADKPAFITEFGCPAYAQGKPEDEGEEGQALYHKGAWEDIEENMAFGNGAGNAIGGFAFEWVDEWWKQYEPYMHDLKGVATGPFPDGYYHEEWFGLVSQGDGKTSPFLRQLRKVYFMYQGKWSK
jgi:beta-glucuronidase